LQSEVLGRLLRRHFPPFPNPHVRTTGFMCEREIVAGARGARARTKLGAYAFESGSHGLTAQVTALGLAARVVSASGESFDADRWFAANTFWRREQEGLLLADKQTRNYMTASAAARSIYSFMAWGPQADPPLGAQAHTG
jgi:hypothetical protein